MYYDQVNDIYLVSKMGQIIKVQRPVSSASISGLYVTLEVAFTIALQGVLLIINIKILNQRIIYVLVIAFIGLYYLR
jgi:hypothetical protein